MKLVGGKQQLCTAGWTLAALVLVAINGFGFLGLESRPLQGNSPAVSSLRQKLARLESRLAENARTIFSGDGFRQELLAMQASYDSAAPPDKQGSAISSTVKVALPELTGILQIDTPAGTRRYMAVLDGRVCRETDQVTAFSVEKISAEGVLLSRGGMEWFVERPEPRYSLDQGR